MNHLACYKPTVLYRSSNMSSPHLQSSIERHQINYLLAVQNKSYVAETIQLPKRSDVSLLLHQTERTPGSGVYRGGEVVVWQPTEETGKGVYRKYNLCRGNSAEDPGSPFSEESDFAKALGEANRQHLRQACPRDFTHRKLLRYIHTRWDPTDRTTKSFLGEFEVEGRVPSTDRYRLEDMARETGAELGITQRSFFITKYTDTGAPSGIAYTPSDFVAICESHGTAILQSMIDCSEISDEANKWLRYE